MNDDVKAAVEALRRAARDSNVPELWHDEHLIIAHIDGEPARQAAAVAAARERMHRCDAYVMFGAPEFADVTFCRKDGARAAQDVLEERNALRARAEKAEAERDAYAEEAGKAILALPTGHYRTIPLFQAIRELRAQIECGRAMEAERDALRAFKTYVHGRLDTAGVPVDPPGEHRDAGCRIGQRLDVLVGERDALRAQVDKLRTDLANADAAYAGDVSTQRVRAERAEAQVEAARAVGRKFTESNDPPVYRTAAHIIRAMDGAKP